MNTTMDAMWLAVESCNPGRWDARLEVVSLELADAVHALRECLPQDATLEDTRHALLGTGFAWTGTGELTYCPNARLLDELDYLIDEFGGASPAATIFPALARPGAGDPAVLVT